MTEKQFIEKAIKGGWDSSDEYGGEYQMVDFLHSINKILLDPLAWKAVEKVEGWGKEGLCGACNLYLTEEGEEPCPQEGWKHKMLGMIDALIEEKTIEDYLLTL